MRKAEDHYEYTGKSTVYSRTVSKHPPWITHYLGYHWKLKLKDTGPISSFLSVPGGHSACLNNLNQVLFDRPFPLVQNSTYYTIPQTKEFMEFCSLEQIRKYRELLAHLTSTTYLVHHDFHHTVMDHMTFKDSPWMQHLMPTMSPLQYAVMFLKPARVSFVLSSFMHFLGLMAALHFPPMLVLEQSTELPQSYIRFVLPCQYFMVLKQLLLLFLWSATLLTSNISEVRGVTNIILVWVKMVHKYHWRSHSFSLNSNGRIVMSPSFWRLQNRLNPTRRGQGPLSRLNCRPRHKDEVQTKAGSAASEYILLQFLKSILVHGRHYTILDVLVGQFVVPNAIRPKEIYIPI